MTVPGVRPRRRRRAGESRVLSGALDGGRECRQLLPHPTGGHAPGQKDRGGGRHLRGRVRRPALVPVVPAQIDALGAVRLDSGGQGGPVIGEHPEISKELCGDCCEYCGIEAVGSIALVVPDGLAAGGRDVNGGSDVRVVGADAGRVQRPDRDDVLRLRRQSDAAAVDAPPTASRVARAVTVRRAAVEVVALVPGRRDHDHAPVGGVLQGRLDLRAILPLPGPLLIGVPRGVVAVAEPRIDREAHDEDVQAGVGAVPDRPADRVGGEVAGGVAGLQADEVRAGRRPADAVTVERRRDNARDRGAVTEQVAAGIGAVRVPAAPVLDERAAEGGVVGVIQIGMGGVDPGIDDPHDRSPPVLRRGAALLPGQVPLLGPEGVRARGRIGGRGRRGREERQSQREHDRDDRGSRPSAGGPGILGAPGPHHRATSS